jgi:hypothetical protein
VEEYFWGGRTYTITTSSKKKGRWSNSLNLYPWCLNTSWWRGPASLSLAHTYSLTRFSFFYVLGALSGGDPGSFSSSKWMIYIVE